MYYKSITFKFIHTLLKVFFIAAGIFSFSHAFAASVDFRINGDNLPVTAEYGENLTLSWTSYQATSCSGSSNMPPISGTSGTVNAPNTGATYVITCQDALGNIMKDSVYSYYANQITIDRQDYEGGNPPDTTEAKIDPYDFLSANPATFTDLVFGDGPTGSAHTSTFTPLLGRQLAHLLVNGANVMKGYLNQPQANAETIKDGWLYTGDLVKIDEDGYIFIVGRKKEMVNVRGFNVYPKEIEDVL